MAKISKTSTFEASTTFSEFSPLRSVGFCPWSLPRPNTAALGSPQRPRFRGPAAPGGEGGRGCEGQNQPWPRRRIWWGNLLRPWDSVVRGRELRCRWFKFFVDIVFMIFWKACQNICTDVGCCCLCTTLMVQVFCQILLSDIFNFCGENQPKKHLHQHLVFFLAFTFSAPLLLQCTDKTCSIDDFSLAIF